MPLRELLFLRMSLFLCVKDGKRRRVVSCHIEEMRSSWHDSGAFFFSRLAREDLHNTRRSVS